MSAFVYANGPLASPPLPVIVTDPKFCSDHPTSFEVSEEYASFSNDDFRIKDVTNGETVFLVAGKPLSLHQEKTLYDSLDNNKAIWIMKHQISNNLIILGRKYSFWDNGGNRLFTVKYHPRFLHNQTRKLSISFPDGSMMLLEASKWDRLSIITWRKKDHVFPVAKVKLRKSNGNLQTYTVEIAADVDITVILALVICLDEEGECGDRSQITGGGFVLPGSYGRREIPRSDEQTSQTIE